MQQLMNNLIFLKPFSIMNPTLDEQNDFMMTEVVTDAEAVNLLIYR